MSLRAGNDVTDDPRIFAVVLAAGRAARYGHTKQLIEFDGLPLVQHALRAAEAVCGAHTLLVTGHEAAAVAAAAAPLAGFYVINDDYADGLGTSLARGVEAVATVADAVLVVLADQPRVSADDLRALVELWRSRPDAAAAARYRGVIGPPAVFPRADFASLATLSADRGARGVLEAHGEALLTMDCPAAGFDIDTPDDLARAPD